MSYYTEEQIRKARSIDLLSYATIMKMRTGEWRAEPMLSLGGVYAPSTNSKPSKLPIALENMTQNQTQINTIALHLDNDFAGKNATSAIATQLEGKYVIRDEPRHMEKTAMTTFNICKDRSTQDKWDENNLKTRLLMII